MYILDTDHLSIIQRHSEPAHSFLAARLRQTDSNKIVTTIVSYEEQMRGWLAVIHRFRKPEQEVAAYQHLHSLLAFFTQIPVLDFDGSAAEHFTRLRRARIRIGTMDLKIAAITLCQDATLLSRNLTDFRRVPGLQVEDWTRR